MRRLSHRGSGRLGHSGRCRGGCHALGAPSDPRAATLSHRCGHRRQAAGGAHLGDRAEPPDRLCLRRPSPNLRCRRNGAPRASAPRSRPVDHDRAPTCARQRGGPPGVLRRWHILRRYHSAQPRAADDRHNCGVADGCRRCQVGGTVNRREAGFTVVEVVVAFAIAAIVLGGLYSLMTGALRGEATTVVREHALVAARGHLESIGIEELLAAGETMGVYATGVPWRLTISPVETHSYRGQAFRIVLEPLNATGKPLVRLETFKLAPRAN